MARSEPLHTRASIALRQCGHSQEQIARVLKVPPSVVRNWCEGWAAPRRDRKLELAKRYGIAIAWWDEPAPAPTGLIGEISAGVAQSEEPPPCKQGDAGSNPAAGSVDETAALLAQVRGFRSKVETDPLLSLSEKAKVLSSCGHTLALLYRLTGAAADISEAKIMKTPAWQRLQIAILDALRPWPDALRAVGKALGELDR